VVWKRIFMLFLQKVKEWSPRLRERGVQAFHGYTLIIPNITRVYPRGLLLGCMQFKGVNTQKKIFKYSKIDKQTVKSLISRLKKLHLKEWRMDLKENEEKFTNWIIMKGSKAHKSSERFFFSLWKVHKKLMRCKIMSDDIELIYSQGQLSIFELDVYKNISTQKLISNALREFPRNLPFINSSNYIIMSYIVSILNGNLLTINIIKM